MASLHNQVKELRLQDKLIKQNFHKNIKKYMNPFTDTIEDTSRDITKTMTEISNKNNKALEILNNKLSKNLNDRGILASYLLSSLSKITNREHTVQFKLVKDLKSNRVNDLLINKTIPVTFLNIFLAFRKTDKKFDPQGDL